MVWYGALAALAALIVMFSVFMLKLAADSRSTAGGGGLVDGRLAACPATPNCVSSDVPPADSHYIAPISDPDGSRWTALIERVGAMPGAALVTQTEDYAHFTFTTRWWGFVDDLELHNRPAAREIAVRSASRVGRGDWNANRNRVESIREAR